MTIHDRVQELMVSLVIDDISDTDRVLAEQHLFTCGQCQSDLDALTAIVPRLADVGRSGSAHIQSVPRHRRRARAGVAAVLAAAASVVVVLAVIAGSEPTRHSEVLLDRTDSIEGGFVRFGELDDGVTVHLRMSGLRQPPPGGMYEAWLDGAGGGVISVGSFSPTRTGDVSVTLHGAGHLADFEELIVTIEPDMVDPGRNGVLIVLTDLPRG